MSQPGSSGSADLFILLLRFTPQTRTHTRFRSALFSSVFGDFHRVRCRGATRQFLATFWAILMRPTGCRAYSFTASFAGNTWQVISLIMEPSSRGWIASLGGGEDLLVRHALPFAAVGSPGLTQAMSGLGQDPQHAFSFKPASVMITISQNLVAVHPWRKDGKLVVAILKREERLEKVWHGQYLATVYARFPQQ